jgi:hypothetical protein
MWIQFFMRRERSKKLIESLMRMQQEQPLRQWENLRQALWVLSGRIQQLSYQLMFTNKRESADR